MKIERLSHDKIRIFLTFDDLTERGIQKEDMWREIPKVHELFSEMMEQAYTELGFDATGPLAVEVLALPAQGMVVIVTRGQSESANNHYDTYDELEEEVYEMEVTLEESEIISYAFSDIEDLINVAKVLYPILPKGGTLFNYKGQWILQLEPASIEEKDERYQAVIAVLSEYGEATSITRAVLEEYGNCVVSENAIQTLCHYFD